jgi:hypothetical protein
MKPRKHPGSLDDEIAGGGPDHGRRRPGLVELVIVAAIVLAVVKAFV